jgi:hypothetical protein
MNERIPKRTKQWIALITFFVFCGVGGFLFGDWWVTRSGIVGVWGHDSTPFISFFPDHTWAYSDPDSYSGQWYALKERDTYLMVYRGGGTVTARLQRHPLRLHYIESDMICTLDKVGKFATTK